MVRWMRGAGSWELPKACGKSLATASSIHPSPNRRLWAQPSAQRFQASGRWWNSMFVDFMGVCFDQIYNQAAKFRYMFGGKAVTPLVIRTMIGAGLRSGSTALAGSLPHFHAHSRAEVCSSVVPL